MSELKTVRLIRGWVRGWWWVGVGWLAILMVFLGLRFYRLTEAVPIFADEAIYLRWAQVMKYEPTLRFLPLSDGKQPLFMWVTMFLMNEGWNPLMVGRMVSVGAGLLGMVGVFLLSYRLFGDKRVSLVASFLYAVVPYTVFFDRIGLVDSLLSALGVWFFFWVVYLLESLDFGVALLSGMTLGAAWLTKSPAVFFMGLLPTSVMLVKWPKGGEERVWQIGKVLGLWAVVGGVAVLMYNIQRLGPNFQLLTSRNWDYVFPISQLWSNPKDPFVFHIKEIWDWNLRLLTPLVFGLVWLGMVGGLVRREKKIGWLVLIMLVPLLVQAMYAKVFTTRYILFSVPYGLILAGWGLVRSWERWGRAWWWLLGLGLVVVVPALQFDFLMVTRPEMANLTGDMRSGYLEKWTAGTGIAEVAQYIRQRRGETDRQIVVGTEGYFGTLPDGLQLYLNRVPNVVVIGVGLNFDRPPEQLVAAKEFGNEVYLVINNTRFSGDPKTVGLRLVQSYPKAWQKDGTREELWFFEVTDRVLQRT